MTYWRNRRFRYRCLKSSSSDRPMPDERNVEINVRCEKELDPDHKMLDSLIVTWLETDKDPPLFAWAQAFKVPVDIISVETIKRTDRATINVRIEF